MRERKRYNKYFNSNTPEKLVERRTKLEQNITLALSGEACDRLIALQKFKEMFAHQKSQITLKRLRDPYY